MAPELHSWELLGGLDAAASDRVRALGERIKVPSGQVLFSLGEAADRLYVVESGRIGLFMPLSVRGEEQTLLVGELSRNQLVGWSGLVAPYRFTLGARALVDSEVVALARSRIAELVAHEPGTGVTLMGNLAAIVARRLQKVHAMWVREVQRSVDSRFGVAGLLAFVLALGLQGACGEGGHEGRIPQAALEAEAVTAPAFDPDHLEVPPPPFSEGVFPCMDCHEDQETNRTRRTLTEEHTNIVLTHDEEHRWCLDCHDADNRDKLHLASGELVGFDESYRLCGQCHGDKYRDWRAGVHGRRTGYWNGAKKYLLCAHCHDPHSPRFKPIPPKPAPHRPLATL